MDSWPQVPGTSSQADAFDEPEHTPASTERTNALFRQASASDEEEYAGLLCATDTQGLFDVFIYIFEQHP